MKRIDQAALRRTSRVMLTGQELLLGASVRTSNRTEMLSDVAVMFAPRAETMAVRSKMEPWSHHDEYSFMTESESPLGTNIDTTSFDICSSQEVLDNVACDADRIHLQNMCPVVFCSHLHVFLGSIDTQRS